MLKDSCMASSKHLHLPGYFDKHSKFEMSDPLYSLLKIQNISQFHTWNNSKAEFTKLKPLSLLSYLLGLMNNSAVYILFYQMIPIPMKPKPTLDYVNNKH